MHEATQSLPRIGQRSAQSLLQPRSGEWCNSESSQSSMHGSTMSPGREDLNSAMIALYSESVMVLAVTDCLLTERVEELIPVWFINFQIGPLEPSMRP
eukprot:4095531-Prymnesium_polylepis.1